MDRWGVLLVLFAIGDATSTQIVRNSAGFRTPQPAGIRSDESTPLLRQFVALFEGHFDNEAQVLREQQTGLYPREGGGHEHIHCCVHALHSIPSCGAGDLFVLASYYFDGKPDRAFRTRVYALRELIADTDYGHCIEMSIFRLTAEREAALHAATTGAVTHAGLDVEWSASDVAPELLIPECSVFWRRIPRGFHGTMRTDSITVDSPRLGKPIIVTEEVTLLEDALLCNDRAHDLDGNYVYGNIFGIPYQMDRLAPDEPGSAEFGI